jgi:hypothetical protein
VVFFAAALFAATFAAASRTGVDTLLAFLGVARRHAPLAVVDPAPPRPSKCPRSSASSRSMSSSRRKFLSALRTCCVV